MFVLKLPKGSVRKDETTKHDLWLLGASAGVIWWSRHPKKAKTFKTRSEVNRYRRAFRLDERVPGVRVGHLLPWGTNPEGRWPL